LTGSATKIYSVANWLKPKLTRFYIFQDLGIQPHIPVASLNSDVLDGAPESIKNVPDGSHFG
ncbi:MAG: hypothetical protein NTV16_10505, partial [Actinobacteria bacterium]|nr:hypothetical protein [Actinomycetota bacterium]